MALFLPLAAGGHPVPVLRPGTTQKVAYTGTHGAIANAVGATTEVIGVWCSTDAHIAVGTAPAATTNDMPITAKVLVYLRVNQGVDKVSAIQQSAGGNLFVTEFN